MPLDRIERVEQLFHHAWELPDSDRERYLDEAAQGDTALRGEVERLLAGSARAERSAGWKEPAILNEARLTASHQDSDELDRYRLLERIGSGGMGVVYKAIRADDSFSKLVAVKIVHAGAGGGEEQDAILRRFVQERQILAGLEHPNIARLLDGGTTADGWPFLVMEYVEGAPISRYIAESPICKGGDRLEVILRLFRGICSAVSCAHRNLIVHRDLKPANILVTPEGEPKLLDFGIAKLMDGSSERTRTGAGAMTPEYASPEQIRGGQITTSADIYSLGVLLFEMLTGARPYRDTASALDLAQAITVEPPATLNASRQGQPPLDQDLENIVQMALRKEPERRYASVEQFSEDIRRYLEGYPVAARPATRGYTLRKFTGRNKVALTAAAMVLITVTVGVGATVRQANIANRRFNDVRKLANSYLFEFHDAIQNLPGSTSARQLVVRRALEYLDSLARERANDVGLARELAAAYTKIGNIQGRMFATSLGDIQGSLASHRKALGILEPLAAGQPRNLDLAGDLAKTWANLAATSTSGGDLKAGAEYGRKAVALGETLVAARPTDAKLRESLASSYTALGDVTGNPNYPNLGDAKASLALYRKALALREKVAAGDSRNWEKQQIVGVPWSRIGQMLRAMGDKQGEEAADRKAVEISERIMAAQSMNTTFRWDAAVGNRNLSLAFLQTANVAEARKYGDRAQQLFEQLARDDPGNIQARIGIADVYWSQGYVLARANNFAPALRFYERSVAAYRAIEAEHPGSPNSMRTALQLIAELTLKTGDTARAIASAQGELAIDDRLLKIDLKNAGAERNQGMARRQIAKAHELNGMRASSSREQRIAELQKARASYRLSLDIFRRQKANGTLIPMYATELVDTPHSIERCDRAIAALR